LTLEYIDKSFKRTLPLDKKVSSVKRERKPKEVSKVVIHYTVIESKSELKGSLEVPKTTKVK
jgi:hypothetical protein